MFTGIVTDIGTIRSSEQRGDLRLEIGCGYDMHDVAIGASIACSGVCLTVVDKGEDWFAVDVSGETISCTADGQFADGARLNLERSLKLGDEMGGHIVTGHVDGVGSIASVDKVGDSWNVQVAVPATLAPFIAAKGSITVNGVSLTVNVVEDGADGTSFALNIIPHTAEVTTLGDIKAGDSVNLEIDVLARYLRRMKDHMAAA
ncbi:riboflavin synthase [Alterisphingorhabdus coralli]|uniref:Riboflavin synthase n=1 Tax=Alterisphingorhabdus coralli TaxID=3071408 RepID=A0AA97I1L0_9SPHN|nr:riboflavin synthase [Parasphingorhabdus sp. SCSIO 66989]WOE75405.1 riboflavin synthase [Parasphingorhabdus sp. SCSIO 66989]